MYGHLDKQPEMTGWREGLGAWQPVREGDKLYGRGGADDGYAVFASICALEALRRGDAPHARVVLMIEFSEESGSPDLPAYVAHFAEIIRDPGTRDLSRFRRGELRAALVRRRRFGAWWAPH